MKNKQTGSPSISAGEWLHSARQSIKTRKGLQGMADRQDADEDLLDAQVLIAHILGKTRSWVLAHPEAILDWDSQSLLDTQFQSLRTGTPLPYLTGTQEFFGLDFEVTPSVLVPRPETELLVERALAWAQSHPDRRWAADVGTGSGCIAVSLATRAPWLHWLAVDRSWEALQVARRNANRHNVLERVHFATADLLSASVGPIDLVCANLPYIPHEILETLPVAKYEPILALDGGIDGLRFVRTLLSNAKQWLAPEGIVLLEMQFDQGEKITQIVNTNLPDAQVSILADLGGLPRVVEILHP
jgi:release factor glutamine methyltransferase